MSYIHMIIPLIKITTVSKKDGKDYHNCKCYKFFLLVAMATKILHGMEFLEQL